MSAGRIANSVIRDNIENDRIIEFADGIREIIDAPEFQRLRNIKQMGLSSYVFPTAEHSRFTHSLGVYGNARTAFKHLREKAQDLGFQGGFRFDLSAERAFSIAALCHDIGHTAFSHVLETLLLPDGLLSHEDCTLMLLSSDTIIANRIRNTRDVDVDAVKLMLKGTHPNKALASLISGEIDIDRSDYLLRDSKMSGVKYGRFDFNWLLHAMDIEKNEKGRPVLIIDGPRGLDSARQFFSARKFMHRQVYFHATVRAAQKHLHGIFSRIRDVIHEEIPIDLPKCFLFFSQGRPPNREEFLSVTDVQILYLIGIFAIDCNDEILKYLCWKFIQRQFPKCILDTGKIAGNLESEFSISLIRGDTEHTPLHQPSLPTIEADKPIEEVVEELGDFVDSELQIHEAPAGAGRYLVSYDRAKFTSSPPVDLKLRFGADLVSIENLVDRGLIRGDVLSMFERFTLHRIFVPDTIGQRCRDWLRGRHSKRKDGRHVAR